MIGVPPEEKPARIQAHIDEMVERSWKEPRPQRERRRKWKSKRFGGIDEMRDYALAAESMEDLRERSRVLEEEFKESAAYRKVLRPSQGNGAGEEAGPAGAG